MNRQRNSRRPTLSITHEGVSCDGCMMPNFVGNRYKCLRCWDFDLCHSCYIGERFQVDPSGDQIHERDHPMQCILSHHDFAVLYDGDTTKDYTTCRIAVLACPYCSERGFSYSSFYEHVVRVHEEPKPYQVNCPLCIGLADSESSHRVVDNLKQHWISVHYLYDPLMQGQQAGERGGTAAAAVAAPTLRTAPGVPPGAFDLPPPRAGARRPMMARRTARPQAAERTDRENRTENREQRQTAAAAAFGMPWTDADDVQDLFRLVQRNATAPRVGGEEARGGAGFLQRMQRLRNATAGAATGNLISNADFIQRMLGGSIDTNYASIMRGMGADAGPVSSGTNEYAAPRAHPAPRSSSPSAPIVEVIVGLGTRPMGSEDYDNLRRGDNVGSPSVSTLTSGESDVSDDDDEINQEEMEAHRRALLASPDSDPEDEEGHARQSGDELEVTSEDERMDALNKEDCLLETELTEDEVVDQRRRVDPFSVKLIDPMKGIRAYASKREWAAIRKLMKDDNMHARYDEAHSRWLGAHGDDDADPDDELMLQPLRSQAPQPGEEEGEYRSMWLTVKTDTSGLSFARDSYWKDKKFIAPRKQERQQSVVTVDQDAVTRNALKSLSIVKTLAGDKLLPDTSGMRQGEEMRKTLALFDMRKTESIEKKTEAEVETEQTLDTACRELDFDFDVAQLASLRYELEMVQRELDSAEGSPATCAARTRREKLQQYADELRKAGAVGTVVLQNPRDDPTEEEELARRVEEQRRLDGESRGERRETSETSSRSSATEGQGATSTA